MLKSCQEGNKKPFEALERPMRNPVLYETVLWLTNPAKYWTEFKQKLN